MNMSRLLLCQGYTNFLQKIFFKWALSGREKDFFVAYEFSDLKPTLSGFSVGSYLSPWPQNSKLEKIASLTISPLPSTGWRDQPAEPTHRKAQAANAGPGGGNGREGDANKKGFVFIPARQIKGFFKIRCRGGILARGVALVECLPSKHKAMSSNPRTSKRKKKKGHSV
jgi:hypothetical protein